MATIPPPVARIISIPGDAITVQLRPVTGTPTEVIMSVSRNGSHTSQFSITELTQVLNLLQTLLAEARARTLNAPSK